MKNSIPFLLLVITLLSASCSSPLDEDTPRRRTTTSNGNGEENPPTHPDPIPAITVTPAFGLEGGNTAGIFSWGNRADGMNGVAAVLVDTSASSPAVWINTTVSQEPSNGAWNSAIAVQNMVLHADSLVPGPTDIGFNSTPPEDGTGAIINLEEKMFGTVTWQPRRFEVNGGAQTGRITNVVHDPLGRTFTVSIEIDDIGLQSVGSMKMTGTLTIEY